MASIFAFGTPIVSGPSGEDLSGKREWLAWFVGGGILRNKDRFGIETVVALSNCVEVVVLCSSTLGKVEPKPSAKEGNTNPLS